MDEPLARLDAHLRVQMRNEFRLLQQGYGVTTLLVTNDQAEAMTMADRIVVLRDGRIAQLGAPLDMYRMPESRFVAEFIGSPPMTVLPARLVADPPGYWIELGEVHIRAWAPALAPAAGGRVDVGIRPEDIVVDETGVEVLTGRGYFDGRYGFVQVELAPGRHAEMRTDEAPPPPDQKIKVRLRRFHVFHPSTGLALGRVEDGAA
jgi:ABC-type sugar transport system ATPase subunit